MIEINERLAHADNLRYLGLLDPASSRPAHYFAYGAGDAGAVAFGLVIDAAEGLPNVLWAIVVVLESHDHLAVGRACPRCHSRTRD